MHVCCCVVMWIYAAVNICTLQQCVLLGVVIWQALSCRGTSTCYCIYKHVHGSKLMSSEQWSMSICICLSLYHIVADYMSICIDAAVCRRATFQIHVAVLQIYACCSPVCHWLKYSPLLCCDTHACCRRIHKHVTAVYIIGWSIPHCCAAMHVSTLLQHVYLTAQLHYAYLCCTAAWTWNTAR
jgi:hypothetical protein